MQTDTPALRPLVLLDENKLTTEERLTLRDAGFAIAPRCAYCGGVVWEPHYGCDLRLEGELAFTGPIRQAVTR